jgi:glutamate/tyrosine decarboxylase-like PLP-dependent enzyme
MNTTDLKGLFAQVADHAATRRAGDRERRHTPDVDYEEQLRRFAIDLSQDGLAPEQAIRELIDLASPGLAAMTGPRFFGWVIGGSNPVGVAADWLASAWGQNTANHFATPSASAAEATAAMALLDLLDLPRESSVGFVTGATMASFTCLAAARSEVLRRAGWDIEAEGMTGGPPITVILGAEAHSTILAGLKYLGFGDRRLVRVEVDANGAMLADAAVDAIRKASGPAIVIAQAGHINSGSFDPFVPIAEACHASGAWLHIDGAFGLWARATESHRELGRGIERADSWSVDGHKWLQTPYDSAYAIVRHPKSHRRAMQIAASYLPSAGEGTRVPADYVPELSRRARGFATWAMIRHLGRRGIAEMVSHHCALAQRMALILSAGGAEILNDVVLNQVAVHFGNDAETQATIARAQADGMCFVGGALWRGRQIMRVSVINETTTETDIDLSAKAMLAAWKAVRGQAGGVA